MFVLSSVLWWQLSQSNEQLAGQSGKLIVAEVEDKLSSNAAAYGEQVAGFINEAYRVPYSFAAILADEQAANAITRDAVVELNRALLEKNTLLSSIYTQFEQWF